MKKHVLAALSAVIAMVLVVVLSFAAMNSGHEAEAVSQTVACQVTGRKDGNTIYVNGSGACDGLSFSFDVNDTAGSGSGQVNIGLPTQVVTEYITKTATVTAAPTGNPNQPTILPTCSAETLKKSVRVTCTLLGKKILNVNLPIEIPNIRVPPGQAKQTKTVFVGGPQQFVTRYIVERRFYPVTRTVTAESVSTVVVTETVRTRQTPRPDGKVKADDEKKPDPIDFTDGETTIVEAGIGVLSLIGLMVLLLLALYGGYVLGWKDKESKDTDFIGALLDQSKLRR